MGALIGGALVLAGDLLRQRAERRHERIRRLADASAAFASVYNQICGDLRDARVEGKPLGTLSRTRTERHDVGTRFFMTPGSEHLKAEAAALVSARRHLLANYEGDDESWQRATLAQAEVLYEFEGAVREIVARGKI